MSGVFDVGLYEGEGVIDLVSDAGGHGSHGEDAVHVDELFLFCASRGEVFSGEEDGLTAGEVNGAQAQEEFEWGFMCGV